MSTRGALARGQTTAQFTGRVRHWEKRWVAMGTAAEPSRLELLKWVATGEAGAMQPQLTRELRPVQVNGSSLHTVGCPQDELAASPKGSKVAERLLLLQRRRQKTRWGRASQGICQ